MLPDTERLRRPGLFQRTYAGKKSINSLLLTLYVLPRQSRSAPALPLAGFVVGKKVDKSAVKRNLIKRRLRNAYRNLRDEPTLKQWYAIVVVAKESLTKATYAELANTMATSLEEAATRYGKQTPK